MRGRGKGERGATMLELLFGLGAMAGLSLVVGVMFRASAVSSRATAAEAELLSNAREGLFGVGATPGLATETRYAAQVSTAATSYLSLMDSLGVSTTYTLTAGNLVRSRQGTVVAAAEGLAGLSFAYYKVTGNYQIAETNDPSLAKLVTYSMVMTRKGRNVSIYSGRRLNNRR